jgi:hypothetical protein
MKKDFLLIGVLACTMPLVVAAQHDPYAAPLWRGQKGALPTADSGTLLYAFRNGQFNGHFRSFSMATINQGTLSDYVAQGIGGGLRYETAPFKKFQIGISGYFVYNLASSNLGKRDETTNALNRYEIGLFDIEDPYNKKDLDRLEELFIRYYLKKGSVTVGKQILRTPFINPQDGRMRPTQLEGIWLSLKPATGLQIEGGWIYGISPRSTTRWFKVGESIGVYPTGVNTDGTASGYKQALKSKGIALIQATLKTPTGWTFQLMNQFTENIFNTALAQVDYDWKNKGNKWKIALQYTRQDALNNGGNKDVQKTYFTKGGSAHIISGRLGLQQGRWESSLNLTRITQNGRFLSPREWGRDPFFTFMQRERNEGLGDVNAVMVKTTRKFPKKQLATTLAMGYYDLPDPVNAALNKYSMPSYWQFNFDIKYDFGKMLKGLDLDFLYVYKASADKGVNDPRFIFNKANMSNVNLVFNYHF